MRFMTDMILEPYLTVMAIYNTPLKEMMIMFIYSIKPFHEIYDQYDLRTLFDRNGYL